MFPLENGNEVYNYYTSTSKEKVVVCTVCYVELCDTAQQLSSVFLGKERPLSFIF